MVIKVFSSSYFTIPYPDLREQNTWNGDSPENPGNPTFATAALASILNSKTHCWLLLGKQTHKEAGFFTNPEKYLGKKNKKLNGQKECNFRFSFPEQTSTYHNPKDFL